ncbi:hypothetical protein GCM10010964_44550 [Caldovatus sediminis]|uniref:DUF411 domain-containing protein n=1 Tax=Caldovatus sediminis TaxID=2041189 RepID=A0A8J2ZFI9_9PROT|nr:DUF411 domain-containing protein [Caldovatus sediminis]GGG52489.1 hypothetical protein GCM10010964_44550 [Caldovatus sediminis]
MPLTRRTAAVLLAATAVAPLAPSPSHAATDAGEAVLYKNPQCGCCGGHADHLRRNGFRVRVVETHDLPLIKQRHGVPEALEGCHTTLVGGYVVEGHVPAGVLHRLLAERPAIRGISLPGMPLGSPGMNGPKTEPFTIYTLPRDAAAEPAVYAVE